jgi:hypothetical protein
VQKAAIAAATDTFGPGGTEVLGCYFHLRQAVHRKVGMVSKIFHSTVNKITNGKREDDSKIFNFTPFK